MSDWVSLRDTLRLTLRPIDAWPGTLRGSRDRSPYSAPLKDTLAVLKRELVALEAKGVVLQLAIREQDLRLDGLPRAGAIASHPGLVLAFDSRHGPLRLFFDRFTRWEHNLPAVALHLEHLRLAGIYGVGTDGQQYKGWQALPAPGEVDGFKTADEAAAWLQEMSGCLVRVPMESGPLDIAFRHAARKLHPDAGGTHEGFLRLQAAMDLIKRISSGRRFDF